MTQNEAKYIELRPVSLFKIIRHSHGFDEYIFICDSKNYFLYIKLFFLYFAFIAFYFGSIKTCLAQPPQWVSDVANEVLPFDIDSIISWEEKQITWYDVDDRPGTDSVTANTLVIKGTTTSGHYFTARIPVTNQELSAVGTGIESDSCEGQCGCQKCEFKYSEVGCNNCGDCVSTGCTC